MTAPLRIAPLLWLAMLVAGCDSNPPLAVADVDLARFQGKWYEIAKLPRATETDCEDTTATYRLVSANKLSVQSECRANGAPRRMVAEAIATDPKTPSKLSLDVGAFYGDYWILEVGKDYEYAVIGHPTRDYLWILSRAPTLDDSVMKGVVDHARTDHFDVSRLEYTKQSGDAAGTAHDDQPPNPPEYGCTVGTGSRSSWIGPELLLLGAVALSLARRRRRRHCNGSTITGAPAR